jgi:hypothetical protein
MIGRREFITLLGGAAAAGAALMPLYWLVYRTEGAKAACER